MRIPAKYLETIVEKWIRGLHFCEIGSPVPAGYKVSVQFVRDDVARSAFEDITQHARRVQSGPWIEALIWHVEERGQFETVYAFNIWQKFRAYGAVEKHEQPE